MDHYPYLYININKSSYIYIYIDNVTYEAMKDEFS